MNRFLATATVCLLPLAAAGQSGAPQFKDMFNGRDLSGWVNINTAEDTWKFRDGVLVCSGRPLGVMCSEKQYENFVLHIEWKHMEAGGNSGVFVWSAARPDPQSRLPDGVEVQMLELEWPNLNKRNGVTPPVAYVHGELFGVGGVKTIPDTPRGDRSMSIENRALGKGEWNTYDVVAVDGTIKLSVNGKFVNGITRATQKKGYFCLESEGGEIHFRNIRILELPPGRDVRGTDGAGAEGAVLSHVYTFRISAPCSSGSATRCGRCRILPRAGCRQADRADCGQAQSPAGHA